MHRTGTPRLAAAQPRLARLADHLGAQHLAPLRYVTGHALEHLARLGMEPERESLSYYERWAASIAKIMVEKGVMGQDELDQRVAALKARAEQGT